jgi:hypothetical protein
MRFLLVMLSSVALSGCYKVVQPALGTAIPEQPLRASSIWSVRPVRSNSGYTLGTPEECAGGSYKR